MRKLLLLGALVFTAAMAVYSREAPRELLWDDYIFIGQNKFLAKCSNLGAALRPGNLVYVQPVAMSARPVVNASLLLDSCSGGGRAALHQTNCLLHAFNAVLLFIFIVILLGDPLAAFFGALVFAVHPAAAELVHIASFRSHLLGAFFFLAAMLAALFHSRKARPLTGCLAAACYLLAMLSVETAVVFPLAALALAWFDGGRAAVKRLLPLMAALAALALFYFWFRTPRSGYDIPGVSRPGLTGSSPLYPAALFLPGQGPSLPYYTVIPWRLVYKDHLVNFYTMARVLADYLLAVPLPLHLSIEYNPPVITRLSGAMIPVCADLAVLAAAVILFLRRRFEGLGLLLAFICLLPVMNIWPMLNIKGDRYLYLPLAGFALAAAAFLARYRAFRAERRSGALTAGLFVAALALAAVLRNPDFRDTMSLYSAAARTEPAAFGVRLNLAEICQAKNDCACVFRQVDAVKGVDPGNLPLKRHVGALLAACGRKDEALDDMAEVLKALPEDPEALYWTKVLRK